MLSSSVRKLSICLSFLALCWASAAFAAPGEIITDDPADYWTWENQVARAGLGSASGSTTGRWHFGAASGNPDTNEDDDFPLFQYVYAYVYSSDSGTENEVGSGGTTTYSVDIRTQTGTSTWTSDTAKLKVELRLQLVRDVLKWEYRIKNTSTMYRRIGFRMVEDVDYLGEASGPYYISGRGFYDTVQEFTGSQIPNEWGIRMSPETFDPASIGNHALLNAKQLLSGTGITKPSRLVFGKESEVDSYSWPAILDPPDTPILNIGSSYGGTSPSLVTGLYYPIAYLGPGQTRVVQGQVQLSWSTVNTMQYFGLGLYTPECIGYTAGDNPATPSTENGYHDPDEFSVRAFLTNSTYDTTIRPSVSISIDPGNYFDLAPGELATKSDAHLVGLEDHEFVWRLRPRDTACGIVPVKVTAIMTPGGAVTTTAWINVAALPTHTFASGAHLTGFPFELTDSDAAAALGTPVSNNLAWYDTVSRNYLYGNSTAINLETGRGYWLNFASPTTVTLQGATPLVQTDTQVVQLVRGWNLISNPFQYSIFWGMCRVDYDFHTYSLDEGVRRGILRQELYSYDNAAGRLRNPMNKLTDYLHPFEGYWLYANQPATLQFTPNPFVPAMVVQPTPGPGPGPGGP